MTAKFNYEFDSPDPVEQPTRESVNNYIPPSLQSLFLDLNRVNRLRQPYRPSAGRQSPRYRRDTAGVAIELLLRALPYRVESYYLDSCSSPRLLHHASQRLINGHQPNKTTDCLPDKDQTPRQGRAESMPRTYECNAEYVHNTPNNPKAIPALAIR